GTASRSAPLVRAIDGTRLGSVLSNGIIDPSVVPLSFFAYDPTAVPNGVNVAVGDVSGDGRADIVTAPIGPANGNVRAFSGAGGQILTSFVARGVRPTSGVRVAATDGNSDGRAEILAASEAGDLPLVVSYDALAGFPVNVFLPYGPAYRGGIFIAAG